MLTQKDAWIIIFFLALNNLKKFYSCNQTKIIFSTWGIPLFLSSSMYAKGNEKHILGKEEKMMKKNIPLCRSWLENHLGRKYSHWKGQKNPLHASGLGTREFTISPFSSVHSEHCLSCWQASYLISIPNSSLLPVSKHELDLYIDPSNHHVHTLHHAPWPHTHMHKMLNNALAQSSDTDHKHCHLWSAHSWLQVCQQHSLRL